MALDRAPSRSRRGLAVLAALASVTAILAGALRAGPASAAGFTQLYNGYQGPIYGVGGLCLDARADSVKNYTAVQEHQCNNTGAQLWDVYQNSNGTYTIELDPSKYPTGPDGSVPKLMCLDANAMSLNPGTPIQLYVCDANNADPAEQWGVQQGGALWSQGYSSRICLDDPGFAQDGNTQLQLWNCNGGANQNWLGYQS